MTSATEQPRKSLAARIPVTLCAERPKKLHLGMRVCDGMIPHTGVTARYWQPRWWPLTWACATRRDET